MRTKWSEQHRQVALYMARILKGTKSADLPVVHSIKFELVIGPAGNADQAAKLAQLLDAANRDALVFAPADQP